MVIVPFQPQRSLPQFSHLVAAYEVLDGDTVAVSLDLGFRTTIRTRVRLPYIDAPEMTDSRQRAAAMAVRELAWHWLAAIPPGRLMCWTTDQPDKYGDRWSGTFYDLAKPVMEETLHEFLLRQGCAKRYRGGAKPSWTDAELAAIIASVESLLQRKIT